MAGPPPNPWNESPAPGERLLPAHVYARDRDWHGYFRSLAHLPARETLLTALARFEAEGRPPGMAIDLGCGDGRDAAELLRRGWSVLAIDGSAEGLDRLRRRNDLVGPERLRTLRAEFEGLSLPPADLVNASFSLPFCAPAHFEALWAQVVACLPAGGRFAGQLFGDGDDWASMPDRTHHSPEKARELLAEFDIEAWNEERRESSVDPANHPKRWHVFHIVARKRR
jgi:tellurite methyltransferase